MEFSLGGLIKPRRENSTPGTLKAVQVTLVKPVAYLKYRVKRRAAPQADKNTPAAEVVNQGHLLGQSDRVVQGHLRHREADLDASGARRNSRGKGHGVNIGAAAIEMMLGQPDGIEAQLV